MCTLVRITIRGSVFIHLYLGVIRVRKYGDDCGLTNELFIHVGRLLRKVVRYLLSAHIASAKISQYGSEFDLLFFQN